MTPQSTELVTRGLELQTSRRLRAGVTIAAAAGWIVLLIGGIADPTRAFVAYLGAFLYAISLALGALALVMMAHAAGARWFVVVRRLAEAVAGTLPLFLLLFVPVLLGVDRLYPWVPPLDRLDAHARELVETKAAWLNVPFFAVRSVLYLGVWSLLAAVLWSWSLRQDQRPESAPPARAIAWSGGGLLLFGFTTTFAAVDWVMSLDPTWASTVFGLYFTVGGVVGALGLLLVAARTLERSGLLRDAVSAAHFHALGRLLLTVVVLWAYIAYSQGFLIWIADVPHESAWLRERLEGGAGVVATALVLGQFVVPFALLLSRPLKRDGRALAMVGAWVLAVHYLDVFWLVLPSFQGEASAAHWLDLPALVAVLATALRFGLWRLEGRAVLPLRDPRLQQAFRYESE